MKQNIFILWLFFAGLSANAYSQSVNMFNDKPANVKICNSKSAKLLKEMTFYKADGSNHQKLLYDYNGIGLLTSESEMVWDKKNSNWKNYKLIMCNYNTENNLIEKISLFWKGNEWTNKSKKTPVYNSDRIVTEEKYYAWNQLSMDWDNPTIKYRYKHDTDGFRTEYTHISKKANSDNWNDPDWKVHYTRTPSGQILEEIGYKWDNTTGSWLNTIKYVYVYDGSKKIMNVYYYTWEKEKWVEGQKTICLYDDDGELQRVDYYKNFQYESLDAYCIYTYTTLNMQSDATDTKEFNTGKLTVYPNPAINFVDIKVPNVFINKTAEIYDTAGRYIKSILLENEINHWDASNLSAGIYFIKVGDTSTKLIKR